MRLIDAEMLTKKVTKWLNSDPNAERMADMDDIAVSVLMEIEEQPTIDGENWILCSDRLPEESDYYMACVYDEEADDYDYRKNWFAHKDDYDMDESEWRELQPFEKVVGWTWLPEPPKRRNTEAMKQEIKQGNNALFDRGYRAAINDMQDNLIRNSRTETIDGRTRLIVTEDTIETICNELRKRCK